MKTKYSYFLCFVVSVYIKKYYVLISTSQKNIFFEKINKDIILIGLYILIELHFIEVIILFIFSGKIIDLYSIFLNINMTKIESSNYMATLIILNIY